MRFTTAGESHGPGLTILVDDFPAGVSIDLTQLNQDLARRQEGYGRGGRMKIEKDTAQLQAGVRFGLSTGAPIALWIENRDFKNWTEVMASQGAPTEAAEAKAFVRPRPGHADLAGYYKYGHQDLRDVLERSSARETAARVAAGGVAKALLRALGIQVFSHVITLGGITVDETTLPSDWTALQERAESNGFRCAGPDTILDQMKAAVDNALAQGTTLGGDIEVMVTGLPPGLGSYAQWDRRLDGQLAQAVMSIQAVKAVAIGAGALGGQLSGHEFHDAIALKTNQDPNQTQMPQKLIQRPTNRAGGLEGGVTNGMPLIVRAVMKPIATLRTALESVNLATQESESAHFERSDITAVPACGVVCEAMVAIILAKAVMDKFGHDSLSEIQANLTQYQSGLKPSIS
jgi:chorismate synthase